MFFAGAEDELPTLCEEVRRRENILVGWSKGLWMHYFRLIPPVLVLSQDVLAVPHHFLYFAGGGLVSAGHVGVDGRDVLLDGVVEVKWLGFGLFVEDIVVFYWKRRHFLFFLGVEVVGE